MKKYFFFLFFLIVFIYHVDLVFAAENLTIKNAVLPSPRYGMGCAQDSSTHKIYCFGGQTTGSSLTDQIIEYDSLGDRLRIMNSLFPFGGVSGFDCVENSLTHKIYCFGGSGVNGYLTNITEYDPARDRIIVKLAAFSSSRVGSACAEDSSTHKIYCFGGESVRGLLLNEITEYDPVTDVLISKNSILPRPSLVLSCAEDSSGHSIYCFGGFPHTRDILQYNPSIDQLYIKNAQLPTPRRDMGCVENLGIHKIYCFGGYSNNGMLDEILEYIPLSDQVKIQSLRLSPPRMSTACAENSLKHTMYCFGGQNPSINQIVEYSTVSAPPLISPPAISGPPRIGTPLTITLQDTKNPGAAYFFLMALGDTPGVRLSNGVFIPLNDDSLFHVSLFSPLQIGLLSSQSRLDNTGAGNVIWHIPNVPALAGYDLYMGFFTADLRKYLPDGILSVSQSKKIKLLPYKFAADQNTVALYDFNEGSGGILRDLSANKNDGEIRGGAVWTNGIEGKALQFDGVDDYILIKDHPSLKNTNQITIEAMVFFEGTKKDTAVDYLVAKDYQYAFGIGDTLFPDNLAFGFENQPTTICDRSGWCDGSGPVKQGEWHHVAVQYNGQKLQTFIDTQLVKEYTVQFTPGTDDKPLSLGARYIFLQDLGPTGFFKGKVDELRISNVARY